MTSTCCPALQMFVATCPHEGGVCCGNTGYCCPADFKCHTSGASTSCVKKVAVLPDVKKVLPVVGASGKLPSFLPPGHVQRVVETRPDGTVVTTTTKTVRRHRGRARRGQNGGAISVKKFRKLERKAARKAERTIRRLKRVGGGGVNRKARRLMKRANGGKGRKGRKGRRVSRKQLKKAKKANPANLPPSPGRGRRKKGNMFPTKGMKGPSKSKKLSKKINKLNKKVSAAKQAEKKALNKLGVRRGGGRARKGGRKGKKAKKGNCGGNACGQPHRVKLNANTEIIIGKPKNTLPAKK